MTPRMPTHLALALALVGCGDGLLDDGYRGEPRFTYAGQMATSGAEPIYTHPLRAGIFWLPYDPTALFAEGSEATYIDRFERLGLPADKRLVEQRSIAVAVAFPGYFELNVFGDPPPAAHVAANGVSYGVLLIYEDRDESGAFDDGELAGGGPSQMVYFARRPMTLDDPANPLERDVSPGYGLIELPLRCGAPLPDYPLDPDVNARVGAACAGEGDPICGGAGVCLLEDFEGPLPGGYCVLPISALPEREADRAPAGLTLVETENGGDELEAWYRACNSSADCRPGYTCQLDVCLPDQLSSLLLDRAIEIEATCAREHEVERRQPGGG
ncbi:MAG: hypothetical protein R3F65_17815 [bacterium]